MAAVRWGAIFWSWDVYNGKLEGPGGVARHIAFNLIPTISILSSHVVAT